MRELDPNLPIYRMRPMAALRRCVARAQRFAMRLLTVFALLALVLAAIGTYGVMAYIVSQGTREIGIRLALGATPRRHRGAVMRQGLTVAVVGVALGLAGALQLTRVLSSLSSASQPRDPLTFAAVAVSWRCRDRRQRSSGATGVTDRSGYFTEE